MGLWEVARPYAMHSTLLPPLPCCAVKEAELGEGCDIIASNMQRERPCAANAPEIGLSWLSRPPCCIRALSLSIPLRHSSTLMQLSKRSSFLIFHIARIREEDLSYMRRERVDGALPTQNYKKRQGKLMCCSTPHIRMPSAGRLKHFDSPIGFRSLF